MSRYVLTVGSTMRIPLLYRGEYSQWVEKFMNYLEEQTDEEAMINCIKNGDQPLPRVTQVFIAGTSSTEQPPLKDKSMCNKTAKDLWDVLARHMIGSEYGKQDRKAKKIVVVNSDPLALIAEKTKSANKKQEFVKSNDKKVEKKDDEKRRDMSKVKCYNCKKEGHFVKDCKKVKVKDCEYYKIKMLLSKKDTDEQVLLAEDQAWMELSKASSSSAGDKISEVSCYLSKSDSESIAFDCNNARNALCNARMNASVDVNDLFVFDDIIQIVLWIINSGCSKHMMGNHALLTNFVEKFLGTVRFGNNNFAMIAGYGDVVIGSMTIKKVYYVEGLGHNLFSVGQFRDKGLEVAFRKSTCFVRIEDGVDLLTGYHSSNLYTIALNEVVSNSSTCLLAKLLLRNLGCLPKMKFEKDHLCSAYEQGKIHQKHHKSKTAFASNKPLYLLHMDLCGPMRVIMKSSTMNVETSNVEIPSYEEEVFHEISESFQEESSSSLLDENIQQREMKFYLGFQVNQFSNGIFINQSKYILDILKRFGIENCDTVPTPMVEQAKLKLDLVGKPVDHTDYQSMIGSLMYVTSSRPDIMFSTLFTLNGNPTSANVNANADSRGKKMRLVTHGLEGCEFENTCNNDKNLSEIQLEHEKEDELVMVVVKVVHELDCMMVVKEIENGILEEIEKFGWWFEQDIGGENKDDMEKKLVMVSEEGWMS
uniref:CCHC-type domain-containing protein n=1 Tax=Tanacetum cinerariifolium TaxID=118510 RepID=A0A6L2L7E7_TANCI|nr:hypothetical protein [Tanacetum cinerariifolium]